ncbi:hypothetical protein F441_08055 [Phytophthora nicotianae CJ01A1]|uniref:Uncharacterized protein n=1 Tax=Phytophthora nicotianae CJ01A1 TaxID=1317063 RepID=W2X496_PHYNI|nr:hypothetical protein F441_08055 [Phytophthora nicotianae CJ01A1]
MDTLESIRAKLSETEALVVSTEEKLETSKLTFEQKQLIAAELTKRKASLVENRTVYESTVTDRESKLQEKKDENPDESFDVRYESDEEDEIIEDDRTKLLQRPKRLLERRGQRAALGDRQHLNAFE